MHSIFSDQSFINYKFQSWLSFQTL